MTTTNEDGCVSEVRMVNAIENTKKDIRMVFGRKYDGVSFIEAHEQSFTPNGRTRNHFVTYYLTEDEIKRMYEALKTYVEGQKPSTPKDGIEKCLITWVNGGRVFDLDTDVSNDSPELVEKIVPHYVEQALREARKYPGKEILVTETWADSEGDILFERELLKVRFGEEKK